MKKHTTSINEKARHVLDISRDDYALCSYVQYRSADPRGKKPGWCSDTKDEIAIFIGITRPGLYKMLDRLSAQRLLEIDAPTGFARVTGRWIDTESECKQSLQSDVNKVYKDSKQSLQGGVNKVTLNKEKDIKLDEMDNEGEENTPTPEPSNFKAEKKESEEVAPLDEWQQKTSDWLEAQNAPSKKVAPKKVSPFPECKNCNGTGFDQKKSWGCCDDCEGSGQAKAHPPTHIVTDINPSDPEIKVVTGVNLAPPRPLRYDEYPNPRNANELKDRLKEYFTHHPEDWRLLIENAKVNWLPDKVEETTLAYCLHQEKEGNMKRTYNTYKAGLTTWFMRQKSFDSQNAPKEGGATRGQQQPATYTAPKRVFRT